MFWYSLCTWEISTAWDGVLDGVQIALSTWMCLLVIIRFIKEVLQVYKTTKQFHLDRYMKRLVREGMIYFFAYVRL